MIEDTHEGGHEELAEKSGDAGSALAGAAHGEAAADAATYLERGGGTLESLGGNTQEIERQAASLIDWARQRHLLLSADYTEGLFRHQSTTAEHQVFYRASDNRAVKCTYPGTFGVTPDPKGAQRAATPLFYLHRLS